MKKSFYIDEKGCEKTCYLQDIDLIVVGSDVFPDLNNASDISDELSVACVLAHEYYGHRSMRNIYLNEKECSVETLRDEFYASYYAFQYTPNLTHEELSMLLYHALGKAREGNLNKEFDMCMEAIKNYCFNHIDTDRKVKNDNETKKCDEEEQEVKKTNGYSFSRH